LESIVIDHLAYHIQDPFFVLYLVQAATYGGATIAARYRHGALWVFYLISAAVYVAAALLHSGMENGLWH
jgi:hypothetical protein